MTITFDETGLKIQSVAEIKADLESDYADEFGPTHNVADNSLSGKEIGIYAEREALIQEAIQFAYSSNYRSTSQGVNLDYNLEITGHKRLVATKSTVTEYVRGTSGQVISAESLKVTVDETAAIFQNPDIATLGTLGQKSVATLTQIGGLATVTISGGHSYTNDSFVFVEGAEQSGYNLLAQISSATATTFTYPVNSGTVSPATGTIVVYEATPIPFESQETGPIVANAGTLVNISGSVPGVVRAENADDAALGSDAETDPEARERADDTVNIAGGGFEEAIKTAVLTVDGVTSAAVFQNVTSYEDSEGRPPGSVEVFASGGTDEDVANGVFNSVSAGIETFGNETVVVENSSGDNVTIKFSRLVETQIYVDVTVTTNTDEDQGPVYPATGDAQIAAALALLEFDPGQDVWLTTLNNAVTTSVPGIITIVTKFDITPAPTNTAPIIIPQTEFANIDSSDVTVASS